MLSEFELIERFFTHPTRATRLGVGDDAALLRVARGKELAVSTDMLVAGTHFLPGADPYRLGHKALAVNLSDMAAMGATPRWATLSLALPEADARWLAKFARGFMDLARRCRVDLIGGDTTRGPLAICVQIMGEVAAGCALRRDGARAGDDVWVSGALGDAALALLALRRRVRLTARERAACLARLEAPEARVALGGALLGTARAAIDISDGLLADLGHVAECSRVAAVVDLERVPASRAVARRLDDPAVIAALLAGGDDYELCFTASPRARKRVAGIARRAGVALSRIGRIEVRRRGAPAVTVLDGEGRSLSVAAAGYDHFARAARRRTLLR